MIICGVQIQYRVLHYRRPDESRPGSMIKAIARSDDGCYESFNLTWSNEELNFILLTERMISL